MTLVPGRACGGCTVCCTELHINAPSLKKLAGVRCPNLRDDCLCAIYDTRPQTCSDFECGWRVMAALGDHWRPDRAGIVLIPKTKDNPPGYRANSGVQVMLLRPDALGNAELPGLVAQWVEARVPLYLTIAAPVGFLAPSAFLNETVADAVRRKDRNALMAVLQGTVKALSLRNLERAEFAGLPAHLHLTSRARVKALQRPAFGASIASSAGRVTPPNALGNKRPPRLDALDDRVMEAIMSNGGKGPRTVALVGPYGSGKTTLLESILFATGAVQRKGSVAQKNTVGDASAEARDRQMSVEVNVATTKYLDESFTLLDCPGSIEFLQETLNVLPGIDAAVVVCEPEPAKMQMLKPYLKRLSDLRIPHFLFVNKIDKADGNLRDLLEAMREVSDTPLLVRQIPIVEGGAVTGFVDLALERAWVFRPGAAAELVEISDKDTEKAERFAMLEKLADYDEHLMEELLSDVEPPRDEIFADLSRELAEGLVVPALLGSAETGNGVERLLKALRHEVPTVEAAASRFKLEAGSDAIVQVLKTFHSSHGGKISLGRVMAGMLKDGAVLHTAGGGDARVGGIFALKGEAQTKLGEARAGDTVALGRLEGVTTGDIMSTSKKVPAAPKIEHLTPVYRLAIEAADRKDEVKLTAAIAKLREEDPSLHFDQNAELQEMALEGQGEIHLKVAVEKLASKYGLKLLTHRPRVPYKETIKKGVTQHGRHKRQSGGHGQFGDVIIEIKPLPRGSQFAFLDQIKGGVVPRQWIPSVEKGVIEYLKEGPLGFPVVDVSVALIDGSYHAVDSSDAAFQTAGRIAMQEGMPNCAPVLLEPIMHVRIHVPSDATAKANQVVSGRRGQLMGFDAREGWKGWDTVEAQMPQSELADLIIDLRSLTQGVGTFEMAFNHLAELSGKLADQIVATKKAAA